MRKTVVAVVAAIAVLMTSQGFAYDHQINGFFRTRFIMADLQQGKDHNPDTVADQRARVKWSMDITEDINFVYFGEIDIQYGDAAYATSRNQGGGASGDSVNLETKQIYVQAKIPSTPLTATVGLQGYVDHNDFNVLLGDMAGVKLAWNAPLSGNVAWFKLSEGDGGANHGIGQSTKEDDGTLWALQLMYAPTQALKLNFDLYFADMQGSTPHPAVYDTTKEDLYIATLGAKYKMDKIDIGGWLLYTGGTIYGQGGADDTDVAGFAAAVKVDFPIAVAKGTVHAFYFSSDDDATDNDQSSIEIPWATNAPVGMTVPFPANGLMILMPDGFGTTYHTGYGYGLTDAGYPGYGLAGFTAKVAYSPANMANLWTNFAIGYLSALEDDRDGAAKHEGTSIGFEACARVGYKFGKFNVSLNGAYAVLGDFYDKTATDDNGNAVDPDNPYEVYAMVDVPF